jgi:hypothetical protein
VTAQQSLLGQIDCDLLCHREISQQHELFNNHVSVRMFVVIAICWRSFIVEIEHELIILNSESSILESTMTQVLSKFLQRS